MAAVAISRSSSLRRGRSVKRVVLVLTGIFFTLWTLGPLYWVVATSVKTDKEIYQSVSILPKAVTADNYARILFKTNFFEYIKNSLEVAIVTTILSMIFGSLAAYAIARLSFRGRKLVARAIVVTYLVPGSLLFIALFEVLTDLHLTDNVKGLMLAYLSFTVPFCTWLLAGYFKSIPPELEEAALVDGCDRVRALVRVVLPLAIPALVVVTLFSFTQSWNEFLYALVFISRDSEKTFTVGLIGLVRGDTFPWGPMMAASLLGSIPPVLIYVLSQRWVVSGLASGSVKG